MSGGWEPQWMFSEYDLKYITYTTNNFKVLTGIHMYGKEGFSKEFSEENKILKRNKLNRAQSNLLHKLTRGLHTEKQSSVAVKGWMDEQSETVNRWLGKN